VGSNARSPSIGVIAFFDVAGTASGLHANYPGAQGIPKTFRSRRQWFPGVGRCSDI